MQSHACHFFLAASRMRVPGAIVLALGVATPAPSPAAGWSPAVTVSTPHDAISNLALATGPSGD